MGEFIEVPEAAHLGPGRALKVSLRGRTIALFNLHGTFHAIDNECPHSGGPLAEGVVRGDVVECPWHMWPFNIKTGVGPFGGAMCVDSFGVKQEGGRVFVDPTPRPRETRKPGAHVVP